jgi:mannose-6-phosphate isomerase-like protein (cupin superfamily)
VIRTALSVLLIVAMQQPAFKPAKSIIAVPAARRPDYIPASRFDFIHEHLVRAKSIGATVLTSADEQTSYTLVRRTEASAIEQHSRWDDIIIVRSGHGVIDFGARVTGAKALAPGEMRGGRFASTPFRLSMNQGDVARVPATVTHSFAPDGAEPFEYLIVKVRRANLPLDKRTVAGR